MATDEKSHKPFFQKLKNFRHVDINLALSDDELMEQIHSLSGSSLFLGTYTEEDLRAVLEEFGLLGRVEKLGFHNIILKIDTSDPLAQRLSIFDTRVERDSMLGEIILRLAVLNIHNFRGFLRAEEVTEAHELMEKMLDFKINILIIEWLSMQNPTIGFDGTKPQLPGQEHPGLGVGRIVEKMLITVAERRKRGGLLNIPEYFHNAYLYSPPFHFVNPIFDVREGDIDGEHCPSAFSRNWRVVGGPT